MVAAIWERRLRPAAPLPVAALPGLVGGTIGPRSRSPARWVTQDVNDPESIIMVTLWDSDTSIREWEASEKYARSVAAIQPFLAGSHTVSLCEVKLEHIDGLRQLLAKPATK